MKIIVGFILLTLFLYFFPVGLYLAAKISGVKISIFQLIKLRRKKIPLRDMFEWNQKLMSYNYDFDFSTLVDYYESGFDLRNIVNGMIKAKENNLRLTFEKACEADKQNIDINRTVINTLNNVVEKNRRTD